MPENTVLTAEQVKMVEDNMGLVHGVIRDRIHDPYRLGILKMDDLVQIGYEGLCKAARSFKPGGKGQFSTYASRVIFNKLCDAINYTTVRNRRETLSEQPFLEGKTAVEAIEPSQIGNVFVVLEKATAGAGKSVQKGAKALAMRAEGYSSKEICLALNAAPGTIRMYITRARIYLMDVPELKMLAAAM